jgi:CubicO group peptidase (beta-lactamase class C family)
MRGGGADMAFKISKYSILIMILYLGVTAGAFYVIHHYWTMETQKTIYIKKNEFSAAELKSMDVDSIKIKLVEDYITRRLLAARSLLVVKNGKIILENYYWDGGPEKRAFIHSINLNLISTLLDHALHQGKLRSKKTPLSDFFPERKTGGLTLKDLLEVDPPLLWGEDNPSYWKLFYAEDRISESLEILRRKRNQPVAKFASIYLLTEIISRISPSGFTDYMKKGLFKPAGMKSGEGEGKKLPRFLGFRLRGRDLAQYGGFVLHNGIYRGKKLTGTHTGQAYPVSLEGWKRIKIHGTTAFMTEGEGGQFVVIIPSLKSVIAVTSKSEFPLLKNSGYLKMFHLIADALSGGIKEGNLQASYEEEDIFYEPNFIFSTRVPEDLKEFFISFAKDIYSEDISRIRYNYAKGYRFRQREYDDIEDIWRKRYFGGPAHLESVEINRARIDKNRAYVRGTLKYSFHNMQEGAIGFFPVVSMIKLKGRWRWLGTPVRVRILDREEYFDAELDERMTEFIGKCGDSLAGAEGRSGDSCISGRFSYNGSGKENVLGRIRDMLIKPGSSKLHVSDVKRSGNSYLVNGFFTGSVAGKLWIPPDMRIIDNRGTLSWSGD